MLTSKESAAHSRFIERSRRYRESEASLLESLIEVDSLQLWRKMKYSSTFQYCVKEAGLSDDVTANFIRVARKAAKVRALRDAIAKRELSVTIARKITSVITNENAAEWIAKARTLTQKRLEREVAEANGKEGKKRRAKARPIGRNLVDLSMQIDESTMEKFRRAQELHSQCQKKLSELDETLEAVLEFYLKHKDPLRKAERNVAKPANRSQDRPIKPKRPPRPAGVTHSVHARDEGACQEVLPNGERCGSRMWIDIHHIVPVSEGGLDIPENLITLCKPHHRMQHGHH